MALLAIIDKLIKSIDNRDHVIGVFVDFSKAFDTVDHDFCDLSCTVMEMELSNFLKVTYLVDSKM